MPQLDVMSFITQMNWLMMTLSVLLLVNNNIISTMSLKKWLSLSYLNKTNDSKKMVKSDNNMKTLM